MIRSSVPLASLAVFAFVSAGLDARAAPGAPTREIVVAGEGYRKAGKFLDQNLTDFLRRLEQVVGWPKGSLKGKAFVKPREALDYIRKNRVQFAILPVHQFVEARRDLWLEPLAELVPLEGLEHSYWGIARRDTWKGMPHDHPGLKLALTEAYDLQWVRVLFEAELNPATHFKLMEVGSGPEAVDAVLGRRADMAMLAEADFNEVRPRVGEQGDLRWVYTSGTTAPPPFLAVGKFVSKADKKKVAASILKLCREGGADTCNRMGIVYVRTDKIDRYKHIIAKYETYR